MNVHTVSSSSDSDGGSKPPGALKPRKRRSKEEIEAERQAKRIQQEERKQAREAAKRAKEAEKSNRLRDKNSEKLQRPGECIKLMTCVIDLHLVETSPWGGQLVQSLQDSLPGLRVKLCPPLGNGGDENSPCPPLPGGVVWYRDAEGGSGAMEEEEEILVVMTGARFIDLVCGRRDENFDFDLQTFTATLVSLNKRITLVIMDLEKEMNRNKTKMTRKPTPTAAQAARGAGVPNTLTRELVELALLDLQIDSHVTSRLCESAEEMVKVVRSYTKAVADRPYKCARLDSQFSFDHKSGTSGCRVTSTGPGGGSAGGGGRGGVDNLWRQQLLQWRGVTGDMAGAVIAGYPTPGALYKAYHAQGFDINAARLLEDVEIRRGAGVLVSTRRLGKEFSRRLYECFTCEDPHHVIK